MLSSERKTEMYKRRMQKFLADPAAWRTVERAVERAKADLFRLDDANPDFMSREVEIEATTSAALAMIQTAIFGREKGNPSIVPHVHSAAHRLSPKEKKKLEGMLEEVTGAVRELAEKGTMHAWRVEPLYICSAGIFTQSPQGIGYNPLETMLTVPGKLHDRVILPQSVYQSARTKILNSLFFPGVDKLVPWNRGARLSKRKLFMFLTKSVMTRRLNDSEVAAVSRAADRLPKKMREEVMARLLVVGLR